MKRFFLLFVAVLSTVSSWSQLKYQKVVGGSADDKCLASIETFDGGMAIGGFTKSYGNGDYDYMLMKYDDANQLSWSKCYGTSGIEFPGHEYIGNSIIQTQDSGFAIIGYKTNSGSGEDILLIKLDKNGSVDWTKSYGGSSDDRGLTICQDKDGSYLIGGFTQSYGGNNSNIMLMRLSNSGSVNWSKTYSTNNDEYPFNVLVTSDRGILISGFTGFGGGTADALVIKTDSNGNMKWHKAFTGTSGDDLFLGATETSDHNLVLCGYAFQFGYFGAFITKMSASGSIKWVKYYSSSSGNGGPLISVIESHDKKSYIAVGSLYGTSSGYQAVLLKVDTSGAFKSGSTYGGSGTDFFYQISPTSDNGYVARGYTTSWGGGGNDFYIVKMDDSFKSGCNESSVTYTASKQSISIATPISAGSGGTSYSTSISETSVSPSVTDKCFTDCPNAYLGNDITNCGDSALLKAPGTSGTFLWSTGATTSSIYVASSGTYWVQVTNAANTCTATDSIKVTFSNVSVNLGPDTVSCDTNYQLDAGNTGADYLWSNGSTSQSIILHGGVHNVWVRVKNGNCIAYDSVQVSLSEVKAALGKDITECKDSVTLDAGPGNFTYYWSSQTYGRYLRVGQSGMFSVIVSDILDCYAYDTINVTLQSLKINLGRDTTICDSIRLDAGVSGGSYLWSTGATSQTIKASTNGTKDYWVAVLKGKCLSSDSVRITISKVTASLGQDRGTCEDSLELTPSGPSSATYLWNEGQTTSSIWVKSTGSYSVTVTDPTTGCGAFTKVFIAFYDKANATFSYSKSGNQVTFSANAPATSQQSWDFGDGSGSNAKNPTHTYGADGNYNVILSVTTPDGCKAESNATIGITTGIKGMFGIQTWSLWPNPTKGVSDLTYTLAKPTRLMLKLTDITGRSIWSTAQQISTQGNIQLPTAELASGTYFIVLSTDDGVPTFARLVVE